MTIEQTQTRELSKLEKTKAIFRSEESVKRFAEIVGSERSAMAYISSVLIAVSQSDDLQNCTTQSIMTAAMRAATLKLTVDPSLGQAHIVPFKGKATFVIGYKGLEQLALRTGKYKYINVATVFEGQVVDEDQLRGIHKIHGVPVNQEPIGWMLYFELRDGYSKTFYMTVEQVHEHAAQYSKTYKYNNSPWQIEFPKMARKTVMRLGLSLYGYFNPEDAYMLSADDEQTDDSIDAEWMEEAVKQEENKPLPTVKESMNALGFDYDDFEEVEEITESESSPSPTNGNGHKPLEEAIIAEGGVPSASMSLETAKSVTNSKGAKYGDLTSDELSNMSIGISKGLKKPELTQAQIDEYHMKQDAIKVILQSRAVTQN